MGIFAVICAPLVGKAVQRVDARLIIFLGILWITAVMVWRMSFTPDVTFLQMALPTLLTGPAMVMFFVPVTGLAMASVNPDEQASAAACQLHAYPGGRLRDLPGTDRVVECRSS
jgi:DHA2 family multidrug resistance protein